MNSNVFQGVTFIASQIPILAVLAAVPTDDLAVFFDELDD